MRRRILVLATVALLALGVAVAVLAARPDRGEDADQAACARTTFMVEDPTGPKVMTYHGDVCAEDGRSAPQP